MFLCSMECLIQFIMSHWVSLVLSIVVVSLLYLHYTSTHRHFADLGIPYMEPTIIFGNIGGRMREKISNHDFCIEIYNTFKGSRYGGFFEGRTPFLVLIDPELIKAVTIKDFDHFTDRIDLQLNNLDYWNKIIINLKGKEWRSVRTILTPVFSSSKLRGMERIVQQCGRQMVEFLNHQLQQGSGEFEMKEFTSRYTLEVIGSCAFGLDCAFLKDPDSKIIEEALKFIEVPLLQRYLFFLCTMLCPALRPYLPVSILNAKNMEYLGNVVMSTKSDRELYPEKRRNDFMQLLIDAAQKEINEGTNVMTDNVMKGQIMMFLTAGFETTSTLLGFACSSLATNPHIQDRLREDIMKAVQDHGKDCTYDIANNIPYLEQVLLETLRMYPAVSQVDRVCTKEYVLPDSNIKLNVGDVIAIPIAGIMQDPEYYEDPHTFNPDRFSAEQRNIRNNSLFLAFGIGPRNCIGLRFAMMSAKFYLFYFLQNFKLSRCSKTQEPITFHKTPLFLKAENGNWVKIEPIAK